MNELRAGQYTSVGSYPKFFICSDGEVLSFEAVRENIMQVARAVRDYARAPRSVGADQLQWLAMHVEVNWEDPMLVCSHSGERIESAYAD